MLHKKIGFLWGALAVGVFLSGCGSKSPLDPKNPVAIDVWTYYNGDQLSAFDSLVEDFNATVGREKGIVVKGYSQGTVNDLETNVLSAIKGEVGAAEVPDIFAAYADTAYAADQLGQVVNLKEYMSKEEISSYIDSYIGEGDFDGDGEIKIFPTAKSTEVLVLNKTDWDKFAGETGADYEDLRNMDGLLQTAQKYYEWTDEKTPDVPGDGKAFFGRDAMANYMLVGSMQLGTEVFQVSEGKMTLNFDKTTARALWDYYYVPFVKGYFAATGRFRSDDIKTGNIISYVGSSSSVYFFPGEVNRDDGENYPIEMDVLPCPKFSGENSDYAVQQGAGMVVTKGNDAKVYACVEFLKWFTADERNIEFSVNSGYLPVTKTANHINAIEDSGVMINDDVKKMLSVAVDTVNENQMYTTRAFETGTKARNILEYSLSDRAAADREEVAGKMASGMSLSEAAEDFISDASFEAWYEETLEQLKALEG